MLDGQNKRSERSRLFPAIVLCMAATLAMIAAGCVEMPGLVGGGKEKPEPKTAHQPASYAKGAPLIVISAETRFTAEAYDAKEKGTLDTMLNAVSGLVGGKGGMQKSLAVQVESTPAAPNPEAMLQLHEGLEMGRSLTLVTPSIPESAKVKPHGGPVKTSGRPNARIRYYWGCGEEIPDGQPRVVDMSLMDDDFIRNSMIRRKSSPVRIPAPRKDWVYGEWPHEGANVEIDDDASLLGGFFAHGNYLPHMNFSIPGGHDFLEPVKLKSFEADFKSSLHFRWSPVPKALGYFAVVSAVDEKTGELVVWSSSEVFEPGGGMFDYLTPNDVEKYIKEKAIMPPSKVSCAIPKGIFTNAKAAAIQFIAYGPEYVLNHPERPMGAGTDWIPDWSVRVRSKSTCILPVGTPAAATAKPDDKKKKGGLLDKVKGLISN